MRIPPEDRKYWIIGSSIIVAVIIHAIAFRYVNTLGGILDHWTGNRSYSSKPSNYSKSRY
jgi:hypothetical protein